MRRRLVLLTGGALLGLIGLFLGLRSPEAPALRAAETEPPATQTVAAPERPTAPLAANAPAGPLVPIIDEILVEKPEVCEGEENLITIKAHTAGGREDGFLRYAVDSHQGPAIPLRSYLMPDGEPLKHVVQVFGREGVSTSAPVPAFKVKQCEGRRFLQIQIRQVPNSSDELELAATVRQVDGPGVRLPRPKEYRWQFGDGSSAVSTSEAVVHRFAPPRGAAEQETWHYLARCEAVMPDARKVVGRAPVEIRNFELENLHYKGILVLSTAFTPRFPQVNAEGRVEQRVRLYHHRSAPVAITRATVTYEGRGSLPAPREVSARELFGIDAVPPGDGVEAPFTFDTRAYPGVSMVNYEVSGTTPDGRPVAARFSIMRPAEMPTEKTGERIEDPALIARILRAQERLGKQFVDDQEMAALEHEGAFDDLPRLASAGTAGEQAGGLREETGPGQIRGPTR